MEKTSTLEGRDMKQYVERGVQTEPTFTSYPTEPSSLIHNDPFKDDAPLSPGKVPSSSPYCSPTSAQSEGEYSLLLEEHLDMFSTTRSTSAAVRTLQDKLSIGRYPRPSSHKPPAPRIVSLPETVPEYSAKAAMEKTTIRVVSMPLPVQGDCSFQSNDIDHIGLSFTSDTEEQNRVRVPSHASELPHTPSPPSSPESVVIIANKDQLAEGFLRGPHVSDCFAHADDEEWVAWAKSPPRPIPALHGPLSLPYARCPSGAEGTVIEEQDNLPRIIWGLEGEDHASYRSRSENVDVNVPAQALTQPVSQAKHPAVPPRLQKPKFETNTLPRPRFLPAGGKTQTVRVEPPQDAIGYPLRGQEPIDLTKLMHGEPDTWYGDYHHQLDYLNKQTMGTSNAGSRVDRLRDQQILDWQMALMTPESLQDAGHLTSISLSANEFGGDLQSNATLGSLSSRRNVDLPRNGDFLESSGRHVQSVQRAPSHRLSALDIAQQYRQQQLQQQQSLLPTPPNSSSPRWSSSFSPYQGSSLSPELLAASSLPKSSPNLFQPRSAISRQERPLHTRATALEISNNLGILGNSVDLALLSALPQSKSFANGSEPRSAYPSDGLPAISLSVYAQGQRIQQSNMIRPTKQAERSLAQPRPPPNTPLTSMRLRGPIVANRSSRSPATAVLPSPMSTNLHIRSLSHQQTRSIPLARLIQRRLSSVQEEDTTITSIQGSHAIQASFGQSRTRSRSSEEPIGHTARVPQVHALSSPKSPLHDSGRQLREATIKLATNKQNHAVLCDALGEGTSRREDPKEISSRSHDNSKGRGRGRGGRGRRGRGGQEGARVINRPERVDGGLVVNT
ncbi:uncharacterized protein LAESUDRAFT_811441 [Laetiporus sulphureus 93-53]|uniref:Uncharacterized protein n=1 Tax=Laetiporus sulphureus 93-53 TaxID=1314785 RepID=A0A165F449_9APHY|nr:uncharacterized protein LAESUDRAFT_811441 [Laetiporus sulphureus 93-53]KZT08344.1 hypothetical protein LAESUDRAFT_811441 [Laetiporus sulphureus 93-53]